MSNRSLFEINHDFAAVIETGGHGVDFREALVRYLRSANEPQAEDLKRFGIRVFGMRHHTDGFEIRWGANEAAEG